MVQAPDAGDLVWVNFDPQTGREQAKNRPALVVIGAAFNAATAPMAVFPVTRTERPGRTRIALTGTATEGFAMIEHLKSLDWTARGVAFIEHVPDEVAEAVKSRIATMLAL